MIFVHELFFSSVDGRRRERERVAYLARTPSASPRRTVGICDGVQVLFHRGAPPPRNPDVCRRASPKTRTDCKNCRVSNGTSLRECGRREMVLVHDSLRPHDRDTSRFFSLRFPGWAGATGFRASEQRSEASTGAFIRRRRGETLDPPCKRRLETVAAI